MDIAHMRLEYHAIIFCRFHDSFIACNITRNCELVFGDVNVIGKHRVVAQSYIFTAINLRIDVEIFYSFPV